MKVRRVGESVVFVVWLAIAAGCSTGPTTAKDVARAEVAAAEVRADAERQRQAQAQKAGEAYLNIVPSWVTEPPRGDATGVYAVGTGDSSRVDLAIKKAVLSAEFELAKQYRQAISGNERLFQRDAGAGGSVTSRYTVLIDQLVERVPLVGHEILKREVKAVGDVYHSFVLMRLNYAQMSKILADRRRANVDGMIDAEFAELERRLDKYREQRALEAARSVRALPAAPGEGGGASVGSGPVDTAASPR